MNILYPISLIDLRHSPQEEDYAVQYFYDPSCKPLILRLLAAPSRVGGGMLNPNADDLAITVGWGHGSSNNNGNVTMPGKGKFMVGGYQVLKKWLSYREQSLLGRAITVEEMREFTGIAQRLAALLLLEPVLDKNYQSVKQSAYAWQFEP